MIYEVRSMISPNLFAEVLQTGVSVAGFPAVVGQIINHRS